MEGGRINPTKWDYTTDLLHENQSTFARIHDYEERAHAYEQERRILEHSGKGDLVVIAQLTGKINGLYYLIRQERNDIKNNLEKIRGLRNGTIKEI